ncbi:efflux RND transporter permease subunit [Martelella soudanensis]|uniref:efflux RND transporter permease subunit n=2 Tax=unclassified Martelella TaxID=2629616 RepID=UPI0015DFBEE1|nr:efflux RND transporter permease subunit [Martelella sp. NC20]
MSISAWAIRSPLASVLLFIVLMAAGIYGFMRLPVTYFPTIDTPVVSITVEQSGVAPEELETEVTKPIENTLASLANVEQISSTITNGQSVTEVDFVLGTVDIDRAVSEVRGAISRIRSDLPADIDEPIIERIEEEAQPVAIYAVSSTDMSLEEVSWFIDDTLARELQSVPGLAGISRIGGVDREIRVSLDPDRLRAYGLTADTVTQSLAANHLDVSGGRSSFGAREQVLSTHARVSDVSELAAIGIPRGNGRQITLGNLGEIRDVYAEPQSFTLLGGGEVVGFSVERTKGASEIGVADGVALRIGEIATENPGMSIERVDDGVRYTRGNYNSAMQTLIEGAALAVAVIFLFLRDWRATIIAAMALPLSVVPTFFVIDLLGFSLNILTLLAITLVTGILVDDAIVAIENIARHRSMGKPAYQAALEASDEIGLAIVAISATIIAVFLPVGLMSGEVGLYFREFGLTVAIAVFFSLLVARLITPIMAAYFLTGKVSAESERGAMAAAYQRFLGAVLRYRWLTVAIAVALFGISVMQLGAIPTSFVPEEDTGKLTLTLELPPGASLDETRAVAEDASRRFAHVDNVETIFIQGGSSATGDRDVRFAYVMLDLGPATERNTPVSAIEETLKIELSAIADIRFQFLNARGGRDVSFAILSNDGDAAQMAAADILAAMEADPAFVNPGSEATAMRPELRMQVLSDKAASLGISTAAIAETIRISTVGDSSGNLPQFADNGRLIPIRVQLDGRVRDDIESFSLIGVPTAGGGQVPLSSIVRFEYGETLSSIERLDRERRVNIGADVAGGLTSGEGFATLESLPVVRGLPPTVRISATGDSDSEGEVLSSFGVAMGAGVMLVMVVLVLLFGSFLAPFTILASLPLSISGVVAALMLTGSSLSLPAVIGILMLMGIVTKNAIMLVDFAIEKERAGHPRLEATMEACAERVRPIIMTTLAMVAGMAPSALALGEGGGFRAPMAITVIGGLIASTVLSLVVVPALHLITSGLGDRLDGLFSRRPELVQPPAAG